MRIHHLYAVFLTSCTGLYTTEIPGEWDLAEDVKGTSEPSTEPGSESNSEPSNDTDDSAGSSGSGGNGGGSGSQGGGSQGGGSQPSSEPSWEPSSEPSWDTGWGGGTGGGTGSSTPQTYILTNHWMGAGTVSTGSYTGWEGFDQNDGTYGYDQYNCQLLWDVTGATAADTAGCPSCEFAFDITVTPQPGSVDDGTCSSLSGSASFGYGYSSSYQGAAAMFYRPNGDSFGVWIMQGYEPFVGYVSSVVYDANTGSFSYENGYRNYEYLYYY